MEIKHAHNKFYYEKDSEELAFLTYEPNGKVLTVDHTEVSPQLEGQGIGKQLVENVVQYARNEGKTIDPQCPFANAVIGKNPEFQDVLAK